MIEILEYLKKYLFIQVLFALENIHIFIITKDIFLLAGSVKQESFVSTGCVEFFIMFDFWEGVFHSCRLKDQFQIRA